MPNLGKVTEAFPLTPSGYEMAAERMAWGVILPPPVQHMRVKAMVVVLGIVIIIS